MSEYIIKETGYPGAIEQEVVQELVRCRDCIWYEIYQLKKDGTDDLRCKRSYCALWGNYLKPDYFCADGERREDENQLSDA